MGHVGDERRRGADVDLFSTVDGADGLPMRTIGSRSLACSLFRLGLVDRVRVMVCPMIHGVAGEDPLLA